MSLRDVQLVLGPFSELAYPAPNSVPKPLKPGDQLELISSGISLQ